MGIEAFGFDSQRQIVYFYYSFR